MTAESKDTKNKILAVASDLFASKGFEGTSMRDIAKEADVNVALINYHFSSKDNLYWSVNAYSKEVLIEQIKNVVGESDDLEEVMCSLFISLSENYRPLRNGFMLHIAASSPPVPDDVRALIEAEQAEQFGPPGGELILEILTKTVGKSVPKEKREWAVRTLMIENLFWTVLMTSSHCTEFMKDKKEFQIENRLESIREHVRAIVSHLS